MTLRHVMSSAVVVWVAVGLGGCGSGSGDDLPEGQVAKVGDHVITDTALARATVGDLAIRHSRETMPPYLPGDIEGCIAAERKGSGDGDATREVLRRRCEQRRDRREAAALRILIRGQWYKLEAQRRGMAIPTARKAAVLAAAHAGVSPVDLGEIVRAYQLEVRMQLQGGGNISPQRTRAYNARLQSAYGDETTCAGDYHVPECG